MALIAGESRFTAQAVRNAMFKTLFRNNIQSKNRLQSTLVY